MKKLLLKVLALSLLLSLTGCTKNDLPSPELDSGMRGELGIDKNINEATIDNYLNRSDAVYRDMRMLKDDANYEAIGGDSYLSGFIKGFEVVPYPYLCNPEGLPEDVGKGYRGNALFSKNANGTYVENFKESLSIIEEIFPKDKVIFLMCGGGGYAGMTKDLLVSLGYNADKIYDIGGYWYYEGNNKVEVKKTIGDQTYYDFDLVDYYDINFDELTPVNGYAPTNEEVSEELPVITNENVIDLLTLEDLNKQIETKQTFLLYVYLPGCSSCASFAPILKEFVRYNDVLIYEINYRELKEVDNVVKDAIDYTPSIFIFEDGKVLSYLDPKSDADLDKYKSTENLSSWISEYIDVNIVKTKNENNAEECGDNACKL